MHPQVLANGLRVIVSGGWEEDVGGGGGVICCDCYVQRNMLYALEHAVHYSITYNAFSARTYAQDL